MKSPPDDELMVNVREGDVRKLGVLFERHQGPLFNFYYRMTGNRTVSEDLVQEAFLRILRFRHTFKDGTPFVTWMYHIARNAGFDHFRKHKREVEMDPAVDFPSRQPSPADNVQSAQESRMLFRALQMLPEDKRELLVLTRFQGLRYDQVGELLGCQTGTAKGRIFRALSELRQVYRDLERGMAAGGKD